MTEQHQRRLPWKLASLPSSPDPRVARATIAELDCFPAPMRAMGSLSDDRVLGWGFAGNGAHVRLRRVKGQIPWTTSSRAHQAVPLIRSDADDGLRNRGGVVVEASNV